MSIYSRSYMRDDPSRHMPSPWALKGILIVLVVIFIVQNILRHWLGSTFLEAHFSLNLYQLQEGWLHTLLTYGLLHSTDGALPWHLVLNGLMLYWFGREVEQRFGSEKFLECFLLCIFTGGVIWSCVHFLSDQYVTVIGASSGVFGILYLFCRARWNSMMQMLFIPLQFTGKQLFWVLFGFQLFFVLFAELPGAGGDATAYSAHLGGILGAFIYEHKLLHRSSLIALIRDKLSPSVEKPKWEKRAAAVKLKTGNKFTVNVGNRSHLKQEVDRILDKINADGFGSLTEEEKRVLDKAKDLL
jgi:membrane associated rhomboid family serine protease